MKTLAEYEVSSDRGYLCKYDADTVSLPSSLVPAQGCALSLPEILPTGNAREIMRALPVPNIDEFCASASKAQLRKAMKHYSFMTQAYVWADKKAPAGLPPSLAIPIWALGKAVGVPPLLPYSSYTLDNWARIDKSGSVDLSNIYCLQHFLGGQDEAWFILIHVAIEARAGSILAQIPAMISAAANGDHRALTSGLEDMVAHWEIVNAIFNQMPERCDPYIYFHRVRPWIHGWKDNPALGEGLIYEGVVETGGKPQAFRGQTGSQSSIVPAMDVFLSVGHAGDPLRTYLDELHIYRPPAHRQFIDDIRAESTVRAAVKAAENTALTEAYNGNIEQLTRFRTRHLEYAASYINRQAKSGKGNDPDVGTGGTPFMKYLKKHRDEARAHLLERL